jgi:hypothetical protein
MNKAERMKRAAILRARKEKEAAEHRLHKSERSAARIVKKAAWKAKQARMHAIAIKDKMKAKARHAAEKAHEAKMALIAKAEDEKRELREHAEHVE